MLYCNVLYCTVHPRLQVRGGPGDTCCPLLPALPACWERAWLKCENFQNTGSFKLRGVAAQFAALDTAAASATASSCLPFLVLASPAISLSAATTVTVDRASLPTSPTLLVVYGRASTNTQHCRDTHQSTDGGSVEEEDRGLVDMLLCNSASRHCS